MFRLMDGTRLMCGRGLHWIQDTVDTRHQSQTTLDARASSLQLENIEFSFIFLTSR